jgi:hypothetical protein
MRFITLNGLRLHILVAGAASLAVVAAARSQPRSPESVCDVVECLQAAKVVWHTIPVMKSGDPQGGVYLCDRPRGWEELQRLPREADQQDRWCGVVLISPYPADNWGNYSTTLGNLGLFGDPSMLQQIRVALAR